jgi:hypothetical protein
LADRDLIASDDRRVRKLLLGCARRRRERQARAESGKHTQLVCGATHQLAITALVIVLPP